MKPITKPSVQTVRRRLYYDPDRGSFTSFSGVPIPVDRQGTIMVHGRRYDARLVAFLYSRGFNPRGPLESVNGDKRDIRYANVRDTPGPGSGAWSHGKVYVVKIIVSSHLIEYGSYSDLKVAQRMYAVARFIEFGY